MKKYLLIGIIILIFTFILAIAYAIALLKQSLTLLPNKEWNIV